MAPSSVNRSKLKTCRNFSATGRCHYGSSCKFSHDASVQSPQTLSQDANISRNQVNEGFRQWTFFVPRGKIARPLGSELSKFFSQALGLVYEDVELRQGVVTRLAEEGGLQRIKELTQTIEASSLQSTENQLRVFNDQVIPFLEILSNQDVGSSLVLENHVATIHNFLFGPSGTRGVFFYNFIAVTVAECFKQPTVADSGAKEKLEACCVTFSHILDLKGSAPVPEEFSTILTKLVDCLNKLSPGDRQNAHRTCHVLERAGRRLNTTLGIIGPAEPVKNPAERSAFHLDKDGPGELSAEGTRHDNDRHDIRKIQIMPTASEINSRRSDYLPCADSTSWHIRGRDGFLDRQFRMLREDTVGQLRDAIRFEIERDSDAAAAQRLQSKYKQAALRHVYKDASLRTLDWRERDGLIMTFQFMQPAPLRNMTVNERSVWWASSKRLSEGALVCLLDGHGSAIFCSVVSNGMSAVPKPGSNPNTTRIMPPNFNVYQDRRIAYVALTPVESDVDSVEVILNHYSITEQALEKLIEFPGIMIPSLYPTLKALQDRVGKEDLPFDEIWGSKTSEEAIDVAVPRYASSDGFQFELGSILLNGAQLTLSPKEVFDPTALQTQSSLDPAQSKSLINALQREVALIQGPPGTGKSYTGVALIKVLLANASKASMGPIICVCYTNHALDQLLEHLLDHGVQQIIRIGSRSKSERLDDVNLNEISRRAEKTKTEKSTLHEAFEQIEEKLKDIKKLLEQFSRAGSIGTIKHHLRSQQPHHYSQLFDTDGDSQGFKQVHRKQDNELKAWLRGHCHREDADRKPLSLDSLRRLSLQSLTHEERKILYNGWISDYRSYVQERILHLVTDYMRAKSSKSNVHSELDLRCLKQANVVGLTTSGLARVQKMLGLLNSKVLICEEAGEILEAHTLATLLPSIEHMILIGDHQQLRPQINDYNLQKVNPRGEQFSFDVSLFERLIEPNETTAIRLPFDTLTTQRRMHPSISALIRVNSYEALQDHASVETYPKVVGVRHRLFWFDHDHHEEEAEPDQPTNKSHTNNYEVDMTSSLVEHVIKQGSYAKCDVAVLTPYLGQMRKLRRGLSGSFVIALNERDEAEAQAKGIDLGASSEQPTLVSQRSLADAIRLSTVDNFQGEEAKIVIISLVRCNERNRCGFLSTSNRINVLLSRAQHGMYIIGCSETYRHVPYWANVISQLQENGNIGKRIELECPRHPETVIDVSCPDDFSIFAPEGGCNLKCPKRLPCGHACITSCHSEAMHQAVRCLEACPRQVPGCDIHSCPKICGDPCVKKCTEIIKDVGLPCGHVQTLECWEAQDTRTARCHAKVEYTDLACGHFVNVKCYQTKKKDDIHCTAMCGTDLPCGHSCKKKCHVCLSDGKDGLKDHGTCQQICARPYKICSHSCQSTCHGDKSCQLCTAPCERSCVHSKCDRVCHEPCVPCAEEKCSASCPHASCDMPCSVPCNWLPCSKRCANNLQCGHRCPSVCGDPCPDPKYCQICCSEEIKGMQVDFLEYKTYSEVDLDDDPCVIPRCGHILTKENMDGHFALNKYYEFSADGAITDIKDASLPFSYQDDMKCCPTCRGSLRDLSRYGRLVRRALLDESTKRLVSWAHQTYLALEDTLEGIQKSLADKATKPAILSDLVILGTAQEQIKVVSGIKTFRQANAVALSFRTEIKKFLSKVRLEEQPFHKVSAMVKNHHRRTGIEPTSLPNDIGTVQLRHALLAAALLLRVDLCIIAAAVASFQAGKTERLGAGSRLTLDLAHNRRTCANLIEDANKARQPCVEADAHILFALYAALEASATGRSDVEPDQPSSTARLSSSTALRENGMSHIDTAERICGDHPSETMAVTSELQKAKDALQKLEFYATITSEERRQVLKAMQSEFRGTGHWYTCENMHPFSIGECGMPMQQARCPQCGSPIGGQRHQAAEGVQRAVEFDQEITDLARGVADM